MQRAGIWFGLAHEFCNDCANATQETRIVLAWRRLSMVRCGSLRLHPVDFCLLDLETLQFAGDRARKGFVSYSKRMDTVVRRDLLRKILDVEADHLCYCRLAAASEFLHIRHHYRVKNPSCAIFGQAENTNLLNERRLRVMRLQLFRINILPVREDDDVLTSPGYRKITVTVNETEITGSKPTFFDGFRGFLRRSIISLHHDRSSNQHLSYALVIWTVDADGHTAHRLSNCAEAVIYGRRDR